MPTGRLLDSRRPLGIDAEAGPARLDPEDPAIDLNAAVAPVMGAAIVGLAGVTVLLLILLIFVARQTGQLRRRLDVLTRGAEGGSLDSVLDAHLQQVFRVARCHAGTACCFRSRS